MFATPFIKIFLLILFIKQIKSEETSLDNEPVLKTSTKKDLNLFSLENLPSLPTDNNSAAGDTDFTRISLSLGDLATVTTANLPEILTSTSTLSPNDVKERETTSSWELIYPDQNSSTINTTPEPPAASTYGPAAREAFKTSLPKYFKIDDATNCQKFFGPCLQQILTNVVPKLKDVHTSPSLDPLYFNATAFQYNSGPFTGYITIRYALVYGLTTIRFKKIDLHKQDEKIKARVTMLMPKMSVIGAYKGDLHVNSVRVRPRGDFNVSMTALGVEMLSLGVLYRRDGHTFLKFHKANATTTLKDSKINATGIFPDQRLNDIVVSVANQYWRDLFNVVLPETRNNWLPILLDTLNAALDMVPFDFFNIKS